MVFLKFECTGYQEGVACQVIINTKTLWGKLCSLIHVPFNAITNTNYKSFHHVRPAHIASFTKKVLSYS